MDLAIILTVILLLIPYIIICCEFPKNKYGSWLLQILKFWGACLLLILGTLFFCWITNSWK